MHGYLVRERTRFKNKIHAELLKKGIRIPKDPFAKKRRPLLEELGIQKVNECLAIIGQLNERIS